jgi:S1-C subfamily serine protease
MNYPGARRPLEERIVESTRNPFVAALLGGLVVLLFGVLAIAAGWVGKDEKVVQAPASQSPIPASISGSSSSGLTINEIYRRDAPGVVFIRSEIVQRVQSPFDLTPQRQENEATGSGFVIDKDGYVLTNSHVVQGASKIEVSFGDSKSTQAKLVGQDQSNDIALLQVNVDKSKLHPLGLADSSKAEVGDSVVAIGNPFGLDRTVTTGIVSALQRELRAPNGFTISHVIQTDAAINPGNSGGPLLDSDGKVIGITSQIATAGGGGSIGIGFAVPSNAAGKIAAKLKKSGKVEHAFLGISGLDITKSLSERLNLPTDKGVLVQESRGPARKAGVKGGDTQVTIGSRDLVLGGDVIVEIDGKSIDSMKQVIQAVDSKKPGDQIDMKVMRGSKSQTLKATLGDRPVTAGTNSPQQGLPLPPGFAP